MHGAALDSHVGPQRRQRLFEARRAVDDDPLRRSQSAPDDVEQRSLLSPVRADAKLRSQNRSLLDRLY